MKNLMMRNLLVVVMAVYTPITLVGVIIQGPMFITAPYPISEKVASTILVFAGVLSLTAMLMVFRNLQAFKSVWTFQEIAFSRAVFLILMGGALSYFVRAFTPGAAVVTVGTPLVVFGLLLLVYAAVRPPVRFDRKPEPRHDALHLSLIKENQMLREDMEQMRAEEMRNRGSSS